MNNSFPERSCGYKMEASDSLVPQHTKHLVHQTASHPRRPEVVLVSTHEHDFWPSRMTSGLMYKVFCMLRYKGIAGFHFISARSFREAIIHRKYDFVLENGVDTKLFFPVDCSDSVGAGRIEFLFVSRLEATKGLKRLVYAWKLAGLRDVKLHIVGKGSLENFVRENASKGIGIGYKAGLVPRQ